MAYNNGRENRKWLIWKETEEKILREHGVDGMDVFLVDWLNEGIRIPGLDGR